MTTKEEKAVDKHIPISLRGVNNDSQISQKAAAKFRQKRWRGELLYYEDIENCCRFAAWSELDKIIDQVFFAGWNERDKLAKQEMAQAETIAKRIYRKLDLVEKRVGKRKVSK